MMKRLAWWSIPVVSIVALAALQAASQTDESRASGEIGEGRALTPIDRQIADDARHAVAQGRRIFRFATFLATRPSGATPSNCIMQSRERVSAASVRA
jgi:hypothetical protein